MRRVLTFLSALLLGLSGLFLAPAMALAHSAPGPGPISGYAAGDAVSGTGATAQHLTFAMVDSSRGDRGTVSWTDPTAPGTSYTASVMAVEATNSGARFAYTIPSTATNPAVRGLIIVWQVRDNSPDTAAYKIATSKSDALTMVDHGFIGGTSFTITSGGLDTASVLPYGQRGYALGNTAFGTSGEHLAFVVLDRGYTGDTGVAFYVNPGVTRYQAPTPVVRVDGNAAWFAYTIPVGAPLAGTDVVWKVTNGASDMAGYATPPTFKAAAMQVNTGSPAITVSPVPGDITVVQLKVLLGHANGDVWFGPRGARQMMSFEVSDYIGAPDRGAVLYRNLSAGIAYRAYVHSVRVTSHTAYFDYVIPSGSLKNTVVVWKVSDHGKRHEHVGYSVAASLSAADSMVANGFTPTNQYTVTRGNLTVHQH